MTTGDFVAGRAEAELEDNDQAPQVTSGASGYGDLFSSESISVKTNTDYLLRLSVALERGNADVKIGTADPRIVLALVAASQLIWPRLVDRISLGNKDDQRQAQIHLEARILSFACEILLWVIVPAYFEVP